MELKQNSQVPISSFYLFESGNGNTMTRRYAEYIGSPVGGFEYKLKKDRKGEYHANGSLMFDNAGQSFYPVKASIDIEKLFPPSASGKINANLDQINIMSENVKAIIFDRACRIELYPENCEKYIYPDTVIQYGSSIPVILNKSDISDTQYSGYALLSSKTKKKIEIIESYLPEDKEIFYDSNRHRIIKYDTVSFKYDAHGIFDGYNYNGKDIPEGYLCTISEENVSGGIYKTSEYTAPYFYSMHGLVYKKVQIIEKALIANNFLETFSREIKPY